MPIPCYLAMTSAEFANASSLPAKIGWMACHYSCYGTGLSNLPERLPEGSLIIFNDRTPPDRHDPERILAQLTELTEMCKPDGLLLDFQRADLPLNRKVAHILAESLPCPVAVTANYAPDLDCAVFLEPPPLHMALIEYIVPWEGRDIWLEAALETRKYIITADGCTLEEQENTPLAEPAFTDDELFCRYHTDVLEDSAVFTLQRSKAELDALLAQASGITRAVGLYQQLGNIV